LTLNAENLALTRKIRHVTSLARLNMELSGAE
jgi:hypothetical protein